VAGWVFYAGAPTAAYAGYACAYLRWIGFTDRASGMRGAVPGGPFLRSPFDVELRARCILRDVISEEKAAHASAHNASVIASRIPQNDASRGSRGVASGPATDSVGIVIGGAAAEAPGRALGVDEHAPGRHEVLGLGAARRASQARVSQISPQFSGPAQPYIVNVHSRPSSEDGEESPLHRHEDTGAADDAAPAQSQRCMSSEERSALIAAAAVLFEAGSEAFPTAAIMDLLRANFIRTFIGDADAELACLTTGLKKEPSVDIRFLLLQCKQELLEAGGAGAVVVHGGAHATQQRAHHNKQSIVEKVVYEKLVAESTEWSLKSRCIELSFWSELRKPEPSLSNLHRLSARMSQAIVRAQSSYERLLTMRPDSLEAIQSFAVFLLEVKRDAASADRYFDRADELSHARQENGGAFETAGMASHQPVTRAVSEASVERDLRGNVRGSHHDSSTGTHPTLDDAAVPTDSDHVYVTDDGAATVVSVDGGGRKRFLQRNHGHRSHPVQSVQSMADSEASAATSASHHPHTPWHDPLIIPPSPRSTVAASAPQDLSLDEAQIAEGRQRRRSSLVGRPPPLPPGDPAANPTSFGVFGTTHSAASTSAGISPPFHRPPVNATVPAKAVGIGGLPPMAASTALAARTLSGDVTLSFMTRTATGDSVVSGNAPKMSPNSKELLAASSEGGSAPDVKPSGLLARKARAIMAINRYAAAARKRRRSVAATDQQKPAVVSRAAGSSLVTSGPAVFQRDPGDTSAPYIVHRVGSEAHSPRTDALRLSSIQNGSGDDGLVARDTQRNDLERSELGMSARELAALEKDRGERVALATQRARWAEGRMRQAGAVEAAASSLRAAINSQEAVMEPQLLLLGRALLAFFVAAALLNIIMVSILSVQVNAVKSTTALVRLSSQRQLYVESVLHRTQQLVLLNAAIIEPFIEGSMNLTSVTVADQLALDAAKLDGVHQQLLSEVQAGAALAEEVALYADSVLAVRYLGTSVSGGANWVPQTKLVSFGDLGLEMASTATTLVGSTVPHEYSASHPDVWYILDNGPGVIRSACNASTALLVLRAEAQAAKVSQINFAVTATGVLVFSLLLLLCVFPIILVVKRKSDHVFAIFLHLPDALVRDMQMGCAAQVAEIRSLFDDHETFSLIAGHVDSSLLSAAAQDSHLMDGPDDPDDSSLVMVNDQDGAPANAGYEQVPNTMTLPGFVNPSSLCETVSPPRESSSPLALPSAALVRKPSGSELVERRRAPRQLRAGAMMIPPPYIIDLTPIPELQAVRPGGHGLGVDDDETPIVRSTALPADLSTEEELGPPFKLGALPTRANPAVDVHASGVHVSQSGEGISIATDMLPLQARNSPVVLLNRASSNAAVLLSRQASESPALQRFLSKSDARSLRRLCCAADVVEPVGSPLESTPCARRQKSSLGDALAMKRVVPAAVIAQMCEALAPQASSRPYSRGGSRIYHSSRRVLDSAIEAQGPRTAGRGGSSQSVSSDDGDSARYEASLRYQYPPQSSFAALAPSRSIGDIGRNEDGKSLMKHAARSFYAGAPPPKRAFHTSLRTTLTILLRFCWPVLLFAAYYMGCYGYTNLTSSALVSQRRLVAVLGLLQVSIPPGTLRLNSALTDGACTTTTIVLDSADTVGSVVPGRPWIGAACDAAQLHSAATWLGEAADSITFFSDAFSYGDPKVSTAVAAVSVNDVALRIMFNSACVDKNLQPDCYTFHYGVVNTGLLATLSTYQLLLRGAIQQREADVARAFLSGSSCPAVSLSSNGSSNMAWFADQMSSVYVQPALDVLAREFQSSVDRVVSTYILVLAVITVLAALLLPIVYWLFMSRAIHKMDVDLKRTRATLLLFPSDVLASVAVFLHISGQGDPLGFPIVDTGPTADVDGNP
jgi:hypothetical protein